MRRDRLITVGGWTAVALTTLVPLLVLSTQAVATRWFFPDVVPAEWTGDALGRVLTDGATRSAFGTGLLVSLVVALLALALAIPAARALALGELRRTGLAAVAFLIPTVLPPVALAMGLSVAMLRAGFAGSVAAVVVAHLVVVLPYTVLILAAALTRYDVGYERIATGLGASSGRVLVHVFVPIALPGIAVSAALAFVVSWSQYLLTFLPGQGRTVTLPVLVLSAVNGGNPTIAAALALVAAVPPAIAVLLVIRHLDRGVR